MYDFTKFKMSEMIECGTALRHLGTDASSMEEVASRIVCLLNDRFKNQQTGEKECALVRFYKTHPYGELDRELQEYARSRLRQTVYLDKMKCLTLLATVGEHPQWNSRKNSAGHQAIPLPCEKTLMLFPMISQLIQQFGMEVNNLLNPDSTLIVEMEQKAYNVFYVNEALGSPYVPAQKDFVVPFGIKSVLGFGGMLPDGNLFAIIIFSKVYVPKETADMFKTLSLNVKMAILPFVNGKIFS